MPIDKNKITSLVAEKAIELLEIDYQINRGWPKTYNQAISEAFTSLQALAKPMGTNLRWDDFNEEAAFAIIQKDQDSR